MMSKQVGVGKFGSPYGVRGWIKVISYTQPPENILNYQPWTIVRNQQKIILSKVEGKLHGKNLIVQLETVRDREVAKTYTNLEISVNRSQLPDAEEGEYYWVDLVGLIVMNKNDERLGLVDSLFATGANDVIVVKDETGRERYIPYIENVVVEVDIKNNKLVVDWDSTF